MAQHYTPIWDDWLKVTQELNAQEKGRLIDAIVVYDNGGDWQEQIKGNERYVFPGYQARIDRYKEANAGKQKDKTDEIEKTEIPKKTELNKKNKNSEIPKVYVKDKDINNNNTAHAREESTVGAVDLDPLILKVQQELNGLTDSHYNALNDYREELGDELVSYAIDLSVGNGVRNWNYVETVLRGWATLHIKTIGEAKAEHEKRKQQISTGQQKPRLVRAQDYAQRDYSETDTENDLGVRNLFG